MRISDWSSDVCSSDLHRKNHAHCGYGRIVTPIDRIAPIARQRRPIFLVSQNVAIARFKRHIAFSARSEEHTSELQSLMRISYAVFCLKKKKNTIKHNPAKQHNSNRLSSRQYHYTV